MAKFDLQDDDPFDCAIMRMVEMNRRKRADYANGSNQFLNFEVNADMMRLAGYDRKEDCLSMVCRKVNRITNLRGRPPENETVLDSYEDLAVYATLLFAMALEDSGPAFESPVDKVVSQVMNTLPVEDGGMIKTLSGGVLRQDDPAYQYNKECYEPNHKACLVDADGTHHPGELIL